MHILPNATRTPTFSAPAAPPNRPRVVVIIPAFNEENAVGRVVQDLPADWVDEVVVVNNNSSDQTRAQALAAGATVLDEPRRGYGQACLTGLAYVAQRVPPPGVVVFLDADYSDYPEELPTLVQPLLDGTCDLVIGSRVPSQRQAGSMTFPQVFGNWLATTLLRRLYGADFTDLGPFRAIRYDRLQALGMRDRNYGWTVEMQLKAARQGLRTGEVPVHYRRRIGLSKVSGTVRGTVLAGYKILYTIFKYWRPRA